MYKIGLKKYRQYYGTDASDKIFYLVEALQELCQITLTFVSPAMGATLHTFFAFKALMMELLPTFG